MIATIAAWALFLSPWALVGGAVWWWDRGLARDRQRQQEARDLLADPAYRAELEACFATTPLTARRTGGADRTG